MPLHLQSALLAANGFRHGFSLRTGGVSAPPFDSLNLARSVGDLPEHVLENHLRLARSVGYDAGQLAEVSQVHGAEVIEVTAAGDPAELRRSHADALISEGGGRPIGVRVADCAALLLACPRTGAVAAVHAGWRGTAALIVERALHRLAAISGSRSSELLAAIFPHIGLSVFEVGDEVAEQIEASAPGALAVQRSGFAKPHVDLAAALVFQLGRAGLGAERIDHVAGCTFSDPELYYSYRRDGQASGRHLAVIVPRC